jgi:hypothetical protein
MASIDYYNTPSGHGNYQYITLEEIINNYLMSRDEDDNTARVPRYKILYQSFRGLREFYYDVLNEIRAISLELSPSLNVVLPPDFVNYVRISWVDSQGQLHPMAIDTSMSIAEEYLQDNNYNLLFDNDGCVLIGESEDEDLDNDISPDADLIGNPYYSYTFCNGGFAPNANMSNYFGNGKYNIDKSRGIIQFGSDAKGKEIVLEYISDGVYTGCEGRPEAEIRIHKFAEAAVLDYIYYQLIKNRGNIPANEKLRARKEYYNSRRIAKTRINTLRKDEIIQAFKGDSRWIK